jgi:hypothetical protein
MCFLCTNVRAVRHRLTNEVRYIYPYPNKNQIQCSCRCTDLLLVKERGATLLCKCEECEHYLIIDEYMPIVEWSEYIAQAIKEAVKKEA